ncbi:MAG: metallophosphoesterase [Gemmataceae bacterium]|nr:metallophosphoesterase [Gemmataceae bacterium]
MPHKAARWLGRNWARVAYAVRHEPTWLEVNRLDLPITGLAAGFDGARVLQISDLHCGRRLPADFLKQSIATAQQEKPDVAVVTGDFIHHGFKYIDRAADGVAELKAPLGVFAVLGNHDHSIRNALGLRRYRKLADTLVAALHARGVRVLINENVTLRRKSALLHLAGVDDLWSRRCDVGAALDNLDPATPRILLAHNPRTVERLEDRRCDLMLSGHTHGGQVDWPGLGRITLSRRNRELAAGLYRRGDTHLYVNKGLGFGWRFRFNVRPEVAVFTLRRRHH